MLTQEQIRSFHRDGYLVVPKILSGEQVKTLQVFFRQLFNMPPEKRFPGDTDKIAVDIFSRYPEIRWLLFHEPTIKVLRDLLGSDYILLREVVAQRNFYSAWHKDTTSQEKAGNLFQWQKDYLMVEAAYYLQDNIEGVGGGLDVQPGTHRMADQFTGEMLAAPVEPPSFLKRVRRKIGSFRKKPTVNSVSIPSKAGDLIIFDFRINHRATQPPQPDAAQAQPDAAQGGEKLAIFLACSRNNSYVDAYHRFIHSRPDYLYLKDFAYPADLLEQVKAYGLNLV